MAPRPYAISRQLNGGSETERFSVPTEKEVDNKLRREVALPREFFCCSSAGWLPQSRIYVCMRVGDGLSVGEEVGSWRLGAQEGPATTRAPLESERRAPRAASRPPPRSAVYWINKL